MLRFFRVKRKHSSVGTDRSQSQRELIQKDAEIDTAYVICAESCTSGNVIHAHMLNEQSRLVYFSLSELHHANSIIPSDKTIVEINITPGLISNHCERTKAIYYRLNSKLAYEIISIAPREKVAVDGFTM